MFSVKKQQIVRYYMLENYGSSIGYWAIENVEHQLRNSTKNNFRNSNQNKQNTLWVRFYMNRKIASYVCVCVWGF